jgi:hypothetical protein
MKWTIVHNSTSIYQAVPIIFWSPSMPSYQREENISIVEYLNSIIPNSPETHDQRIDLMLIVIPLLGDLDRYN